MTTTATPAASSATSRRQTEDRLLRRYACVRTPELRDELVERFLPLARHAALRYSRGNEPFDDLLQVASIGLLKAVDRFDPGNGASFSSYALPTMVGELRRHFRDLGWAVRPPRDLQDHALRVDRATTTLTRDLGRSPTIDEICHETGLGPEAVLDARQAFEARRAASLSAPMSVEDDGSRELADTFGAEDPGYGDVDRRATLDTLAEVLGKRDREILRLRLEEDLTQSDIAERVGLSQMHVSRLLREIFRKLHAAAAAEAVAAGD